MKNQVNKNLICLFIYYIGILILFLNLNFSFETKAQEPKEELISEEFVVELEPVVSENLNKEINIVTYSYDDIKYLSSIIWAEAGNQCLAGKQAVGIVVLNRREDERFEDTIKGVIYEEGQFSPVSSGSLDKALRMFDNNELPKECVEAAMYVLEGNTDVVYNDQPVEMKNYCFFNRSKKGATLQIQDHYFR